MNRTNLIKLVGEHKEEINKLKEENHSKDLKIKRLNEKRRLLTKMLKEKPAPKDQCLNDFAKIMGSIIR